MISKLVFSVILIIVVSSTNSLKILGLFPHAGLSHFHFFHPIMRNLADVGHDVTVVSHFPDKNAPSNYKDFLLSKEDKATNCVDLEWFTNRPFYQPIGEFIKLYNYGSEACKLALNSTIIHNLIDTKQKYDVILVEQFNSDCMMGVAWKLKAPVIGLSSCSLMPWHFDRFGNPFTLSYITGQPLGFTDSMNYVERLTNWIIMNTYKVLYDFFTLRDNDKIIRKYLRDEKMPYLGELIKETSMMFVNTHYSLSGSKPTSQSVIEIGGIHIKEAKPIDPELEAILNSSSENGVIYVSWGSLIRADTLPEVKRNSLLKSFGSLKQKVLWKWENETLPNQPKNVFIRKWMPQRDILCHPNIRVFISHGGLLGSSESAHCGVPMVLTPIFGDQFFNSAGIKSRGMGFVVSYEDITEETMTTAINNALSSKAQENAKKVSYSFRNRPQSPIDTAIWWVEHVAATKGAPFLKSHSINMSAFTYYSFDVYATIGVILLVIAYSSIYLMRKCLKKVKSQKAKSKTE